MAKGEVKDEGLTAGPEVDRMVERVVFRRVVAEDAPVPAYSTDIARAYDVLNYVLKLPPPLPRHFFEALRISMAFPINASKDPLAIWLATTESHPLVICIAAFLACGGEEVDEIDAAAGAVSRE